jgi:hypothetical protein
VTCRWIGDKHAMHKWASKEQVMHKWASDIGRQQKGKQAINNHKEGGDESSRQVRNKCWKARNLE